MPVGRIFSLSRKLDRLAAATADEIERAYTDTLAVLCAGWDEPVTQAVRRAYPRVGAPWDEVDGAEPEATALVWGTAAHALDYDDVHMTSVTHPSAVLIPAIEAAARSAPELRDRRSTAFALGLAVNVGLGNAIGFAHYAKGWHATSTIGAVAAGAAVAHLFGLEERAFLSALAIAAAQAGGLQRNFGTMAKPLQAGLAAQAGVRAARLAMAGLEGPADVLAGDNGFIAVFEGGADAELELDVEAAVAGSEPQPYTTTLFYTRGQWRSGCTCPYGDACKHAYAAGLAWLAHVESGTLDGVDPAKVSTQAPPREPTPAPPATFRQQWSPVIARQLGRALTADEHRQLDELSALFAELQQAHGTLYPGALLPGAPLYKPAYVGWWDANTAPADPWALWQYIAYDYELAGRALPDVFRPLTNTAPIRAVIEERLAQHELAAWQRALDTDADATPAHPALFDVTGLRVRIHPAVRATRHRAPHRLRTPLAARGRARPCARRREPRRLRCAFAAPPASRPRCRQSLPHAHRARCDRPARRPPARRRRPPARPRRDDLPGRTRPPRSAARHAGRPRRLARRAAHRAPEPALLS